MFLKISQILQENIMCSSLILVKLQDWFAATFLKKDSNTGVIL